MAAWNYMLLSLVFICLEVSGSKPPEEPNCPQVTNKRRNEIVKKFLTFERCAKENGVSHKVMLDVFDFNCTEGARDRKNFFVCIFKAYVMLTIDNQLIPQHYYDGLKTNWDDPHFYESKVLPLAKNCVAEAQSCWRDELEGSFILSDCVIRSTQPVQEGTITYDRRKCYLQRRRQS